MGRDCANVRGKGLRFLFATTSLPDVVTITYFILLCCVNLCTDVPQHSISTASRNLPHLTQKIARIFGGEATPPGTLTGSLTTKNSYLPVSLQCFPSASRSKSSPMGMPQPASITS